MRSAALPRFSSKIPGFISYVILRALIWSAWSAPQIKALSKTASMLLYNAVLRMQPNLVWGTGCILTESTS